MKTISSQRRQPQMTILGLGAIQLILALIAMLLLSQCKKAESPRNAEPIPESIRNADTAQVKFLVDTEYVHIASHLPDDVKQKLAELEKLNFEKGTLGEQLLNYLKRGDNDFGEEFKFIDLQFQSKKADFIPRFTHELTDLAKLMERFPGLRIKLMAYTDGEGDEKANEMLTEKRALAIRAKLVEAGIQQDRIEYKAYGEKYPVGDNKTFDGRMLNNRIELMVLSK